MNIKDYISSGVIESYVLGLASEAEKAEFERLLKKHPELVQVREEFELELEKQAFTNAETPPAFLKDKIFQQIQEEQGRKVVKIVTMHPRKISRTINAKKWAIAASVILMLGCGYMIYTMYVNNQKLKSEIADSKRSIEKLETKEKMIAQSILPPNTQIKPAKVSMPQQDIPPVFEVFSDSTSADIYLIIKNLKKLKEGQHYELWSFTGKEKKSLGIFDAPEKGDKLILGMKNAANAESFAITIVEARSEND